MRSPEACPRLCTDCPLVLAGVTAELTSLQMLTEEEMRSIKYGGGLDMSAHQIDRALSRLLVASFTVVESVTPKAEVGAVAAEVILTSRTHQGLREAFQNCERPSNPGWWARQMGKTAMCGALSGSIPLSSY